MENATKALLIAAAVLVAILLISLGVGVFNSAQEQMGNADLSEYQIQQHNDKFNRYIGENKTGSEVNTLLKTVFNHNNNQADTDTCVKVDLLKSDGTSVEKALIKSENSIGEYEKVSTAAKFTVKVGKTSSGNLITEITIQENLKSTT